MELWQRVSLDCIQLCPTYKL